MLTFITMFFASFLFIFFKAFQQRNVAFDHYIAVIPTSLLMSITEVYVIINMVDKGYTISTIASVGFGAGIGAVFAMYVHNRMFKRKEEK